MQLKPPICRPTVVFFLIVFQIEAKRAAAQAFDSTFFAQNSFERSDSALVADTLLFPNDTTAQFFTYYKTQNPAWAPSGSRTYIYGAMWRSACITLQPDYRFVYEEGHEVGQLLTVGKWRRENDSSVCLQWDGYRSMQITRSKRLTHKYLRYPFDHPFPQRIEDWRFTVRRQQLVPKKVL